MARRQPTTLTASSADDNLERDAADTGGAESARRSILERLARKELSAEDAAEALRALGGAG